MEGDVPKPHKSAVCLIHILVTGSGLQFEADAFSGGKGEYFILVKFQNNRIHGPCCCAACIVVGIEEGVDNLPQLRAFRIEKGEAYLAIKGIIVLKFTLGIKGDCIQRKGSKFQWYGGGIGEGYFHFPSAAIAHVHIRGEYSAIPVSLVNGFILGSILPVNGGGDGVYRKGAILHHKIQILPAAPCKTTILHSSFPVFDDLRSKT